MSALPPIPQNETLEKVARRSHKRPRLYAIATKPSTPGQPSTAEWSLDLHIPPVTTDSGYISSDEQPITTVSSAASVTSTEAAEEQRYYFNRFNPAAFSQDSPTEVIARISLSSVPCGAESPVESIELVHQIAHSLEAVYLTPDSASWLRQALFALQKAEILPAVTSGFAVNNFMSFATTHLEGLLGNQSEGPSEVKYSTVLRDHQRQRGATLGSPQAPRSVPVGVEDPLDDQENDEYEWSLPYRGKQARDGQVYGGFRFTGRSAPSSRSSSRARGVSEPWRSTDIYSGFLPGQLTSH